MYAVAVMQVLTSYWWQQQYHSNYSSLIIYAR